jgi:hypothetical protein
VPSCSTQSGKAFPPRRIVQVARGFADNGFVQSICDLDFSLASQQLAKHIGAQLGTGCVARAPERGSDGKVACDLIWELPTAGQAPESTATSCSELDFAQAAGTSNTRGGKLCKIDQVAVSDGKPGSGEGWYLEDAEAATCAQSRQHVAFTDAAKVPTGVRVFLSCD